MIDARPKTPPKRPCIFARCAGGKTSASTVNTDAKSTPPATPWRERKITSWVMSCESPQSQDAMRKPIMPPSRKGLRPKRSPSLPEIGVITVDVTR